MHAKLTSLLNERSFKYCLLTKIQEIEFVPNLDCETIYEEHIYVFSINKIQ